MLSLQLVVGRVRQYFCPISRIKILILGLEVPLEILVEQVLSFSHEMLKHVVDELGIEVAEERVHQALAVAVAPRVVVPLVEQIFQLELIDWHRSHPVRRILLPFEPAGFAVIQMVVDVLEYVED